MFMLDTDICVYVMNERHEALTATFAEHAHEICISAVSHAELWFGAEHSAHVERNRSQLDDFLRDLDIRPFGVEAGQHYGRIRELLTRRGTPIGANDLLIAAHARSMAATLVTNNSREFGRVPGLETVSWVDVDACGAARRRLGTANLGTSWRKAARCRPGRQAVMLIGVDRAIIASRYGRK